ncbi:MAG: ribulose-phosphate 3-epimerase [Thermoplasmata archaeon]|nr:MAG: ribulose-phosphate 3-epimerase [Thermoplasmata archaeon]MCD6222874.1 ribulose-phosphate 3-epimerase [Thermoplasmata archaeon]
MIVAPSLLSADFSKLGEEIKAVEPYADWIHLDIMDGHFVPNITIGAPVVKSIRKVTMLPFDAHLMISEPEKYYMDFVKAGADIITVHAEATHSLYRLVKEIKKHCKVGVALNPATSLSTVENILDEIDLLLIMTVEPGFGGQKFIDGMVKKIRKARKMFDGYISVDGGINGDSVKKVKRAGVDVVVAGSYIFGSKSYKKAIESLRI